MDCLSKPESEKHVLESIHLYAQKKHYHDIEAILLAGDSSQHYVIPLHAMSLLEYNIEFAHFLFKQPDLALKLLDRGFTKAAQDIYQNHDMGLKISIKENLHVRLTALPSCPEIYRTILPKCSDIGQFLCISGTVIRVTMPKMLEFRKQWLCTKCKYKITKDVEAENDFAHIKPSVCSNPDPCNNKNFISPSGVNAHWCRDYQEVKVQEQVQNLVVGTVPRSMWVILENDLVDSCQPGNDVIISGVMRTRWQRLVKGCKSEIELVLVAHNVEVKNNNAALGTVAENSLKEFEAFWLEHRNNPLQGRDFILSCLCPQVFGLYIVKLSVALVLAGGVQRIDNDSVIRGDSHLLLVGDPGTGKSQFLKYASKISRRSVLTSGIGTTTAGLTAAAVKDGGKWQLEAGALVLADGGICCIDEFNNIKTHDKASIHEAMEQQTISIAKAGLVCKLSTQCSILASTNPKGKYNKQESLSVNTAMASPLLSRFDVILVLLDTYDANWDNLVSSYILEGKDTPLGQGTSTSWSMAKMRAYFSTIRNIKPKLTNDCDRVLQAYYHKHRSSEDRSAARTTPRLLQSLIRLAQGHARLMFRMEVLVVDAIVAITIMESSMVGFALFEGIDALHTTFPDDSELHYQNQVKYMLEVLELHDILEKEQIAAPKENRDHDIREIILTQMDPFFNAQSQSELVSKPLFSENSVTPTLNNSQNEDSQIACNRKANVLIDDESSDSLDALPDIDPFAGESDESSKGLFGGQAEKVQDDSESAKSISGQPIISFSPNQISTQRSSSKYFLDKGNLAENTISDSATVDRRTLKQSQPIVTDFYEFPLAKKPRIAPSESSDINYGYKADNIPDQWDKEISRNVAPHPNLRKKKVLDVISLPNDVSTLSELNAMFSNNILNNSNDHSMLNFCDTMKAQKSSALESFAFKPKPVLKTAHCSFQNSDNTSSQEKGNDHEKQFTQPLTPEVRNSQWKVLTISDDTDVLNF